MEWLLSNGFCLKIVALLAPKPATPLVFSPADSPLPSEEVCSGSSFMGLLSS